MSKCCPLLRNIQQKNTLDRLSTESAVANSHLPEHMITDDFMSLARLSQHHSTNSHDTQVRHETEQ